MARQTSVTEADLEFMLIDENAKPKPLPYSLLEKITNGFSGAHIIGYGGSADVYEGFIGNHKIAVKRLRIPYQHEKEFSQEIECLMKVKHINVVRFIGYCSDTQGQAEKYEDNHVMADSQERLICFEFLPACLDKYIKDPSCSLEWRQRYQIINGVCQGLHQLHEHEILHLDLNPRNILLDDDMVPKISDFGISKCLKKNQGHFYTETISGTPIYMSPERGKHGPITKKSDLFSLGVTVIEIMTGNKENIDQATVEDVFASCIKIFNDKSLTAAQVRQIMVCAEIGIKCRNSEPDKRPSNTKEIIDKLEEEARTEESQESGKLLKVLPTLLLFDLHPGKLIPCSLQLTNDTDEHMAYKLSITESVDWSKYFTTKLPLYGIVQARSTYTVILTVLLECDALVINRSCYMTLQSCTLAYEYIWKFNNTLEFEDFLEVKKTENAVKEVKLKAFLCEEGRSISKQTRPRVKLLSIVKPQTPLLSLDAHPTKPWVITGHAFGHVRIWNHETQKLLYSFKLSLGPVYSVKFIARKQWFVSSSAEGLIHVYSMETKMQKVKSYRAHDGVSISLAVHPTLPYVLSWPCSGPHEKKLWNWEKGWDCTQTFEREYVARNFVCQVAFDPKETNRFASASNYRVKVWSVDLPKCNYNLPGFFNEVNFLEFFTRDDQQYLIITVSHDKTAKIWDMRNKKYVSDSMEQNLMSPVSSVFSHPNLPILLTRSTDGTSHFWSPKDFRFEAVLDCRYGGHVWGIACLMGSKRRFVIGQETALTILDVGDQECQDMRQEGTSSEVITPGSSELLLDVHPLTLHFPFHAHKLIPCTLHLTNKTDEHVAFNLSIEDGMESWQQIFVRMPLSGIVPPKSTYTLVVTMRELTYLPTQNFNLTLQSNICEDRYIYSFMSLSESDQFFEDLKEIRNVAPPQVKLKAVFSLQGQTTFENGSSTGENLVQPLINIWTLFNPAKDFSSMLISLDADPTESWVITGHRHGDVALWKHGMQKMMSLINISGEASLPRNSLNTQHDVYSVKFIARKRWFVAGTCDGFIHVYKYETRIMDCIKRFRAYSSGIIDWGICSSRALIVHPTQPYLLSTCEEMKLWDWDDDWKCIQKFGREHTDSILQVAFSPNDSFASVSSDHTIKLWCLKSPTSECTLHGHSDKVNCLDFVTHDGQQYLISGSQDCTAKAWALKEKECVQTMDVFMSPVVSVISLPDTPYITTGSADGTIHLWSSANFRLERILSLGLCGPVWDLRLIGPTRIVIQPNNYEISVIMDIDTGSEASSSAPSNELIQVDPKELRFPVAQEVSSTLEIRNVTDHHVAFCMWSLNHTANYIAVPNIEVLSPQSMRQVVITRIARREPVPADPVDDIVYVKGTTVVQGTTSADVTYDMFDGTRTGQILQPAMELNVVLVADSEIIHKARLPWALDVHPTMPWIMMAQGDYQIRIWNYKTRIEKPIAIKGREVTSAKFIMHKQWILAGCSSGLVYVYRYEPEKKKSVEKIRVLQGHSNAINSLAVHSTKPCVLSASKDGKILIWDYENEWELMKTFDVKSPVQHVAFSPKDSNMFASAQDKTVKIWDWHSGNCKSTLSGHSDLVLCLDYFSQGDQLYLITGSRDKTAKIWDCKTRSCVRTLEGHTDVVNVACCHPDLLILITGSLNGSVRLWDLNRSTTFRYELIFDLGEVYAIASLKGTRIVIGNEIGLALVDIDLEGKKDGYVKSNVAIMDSKNDTDQNMKELSPTASSSEVQKVSSIIALETLYKMKSSESSIDVHPTETWMVITSDKYVHIWDYHTREVKQMMDTKGAKVRLAKFIARKQWVIAGATSGFIFVYDYDSKKEIIHVLCNHTEPIKSLAIHGTEPLVLSASVDGKILLWDYANDWHLIKTFDARSQRLVQVAFNPKDTNMFASAQGKTVKIWDRQHDECQYKLDEHSHQIECFDYFSGGDFDKLYIVTGSQDKTAKIWDCENAGCVQTLEGHAGPVRAVCYHQNLSLLITGCSDGSIHLWNSTTFRLEHKLNFADFGLLSSVACLKGSKRIAIRSREGLALVDIDIEDKKDSDVESITTTASMNDTGPITEENGVAADHISDDHLAQGVVYVHTEIIGKVNSACTIDVHPTKPWMVITQANKFVHVWDYHTKVVEWTIQIKGAKVSSAKFIASQDWIVAGTTRGFLHVYDCELRKEIRRLCEHPKSITSLAVDDDALELVLSASIDGKILIWSYWHYYHARRRSTWHLEKTFDAGSQCLKQVAFIAPSVHRSSSTIIATARDGTVKIWDPDRSDGCREFTLAADSGQIVECFDWFSRGADIYLVTGSRDNTAKIWDIEDGSCVRTLEGHADHVTVVCYHPDLSMLITGSRDGSIRLWNSTTFRFEHELNFDLGSLSSLACIKGSTRIAIGYERGLVLADICTQEHRA